jgi:hypothetical protein
MVARGFEQPIELDGKFIPEDDYERLVGAAHLLFAPLPELAIGGLKLGEDRAFGIHFSAIRFGKPMLLPVWTPMDEEFEDSIVRYHDHNDLIQKIRLFLDKPDALDAVAGRALKNARQFTPKNSSYAEALLALGNCSAKEFEFVDSKGC